MAKRGFFAELNHQAQLAEKRRKQQQAAATRAHNAAVREAERARNAATRAQAAAVRASAAEKKAAEKEAARLHLEARAAEVESKNSDLQATYEDIDNLLAWTLEFDDHVDLESLRVTAEHPTFDPGALGNPVPPVPPLVVPPPPHYEEPAAPTGISGAFGGKKRHAQAIEQAQAHHAQVLAQWQAESARQRTAHDEQVAAQERAEAHRLSELAKLQATYQAECERRDGEAAEKNADLQKFINDLAFDVEDAIQDYVGIVLSNSVYPEAFQVEHDFEFDLATRELTLKVDLPGPSTVPSVKEYRYVKSKDEITESQLSQKAQKDRYASATHQVAVRTLHEVFEADRPGRIHSIALTLGVTTTSPATGQVEFVPLVSVGADRETFSAFDLSNVVPLATLEHLGASISKSPFDLSAADMSRGVRQRGAN